MSRGGSVATPPPVSNSSFPRGAISDAWARGEFVIGLAHNNEAPTIKIRRSEGQLILEWSGGGLLEQSADVSDPNGWTPVAGNPNPYTIPAPAGNAYFRVKL